LFVNKVYQIGVI